MQESEKSVPRGLNRNPDKTEMCLFTKIRREAYWRVINHIVTYASVVWCTSMERKCNIRIFKRIQRKCCLVISFTLWISLCKRLEPALLIQLIHISDWYDAARDQQEPQIASPKYSRDPGRSLALCAVVSQDAQHINDKLLHHPHSGSTFFIKRMHAADVHGD